MARLLQDDPFFNKQVHVYLPCRVYTLFPTLEGRLGATYTSQYENVLCIDKYGYTFREVMEHVTQHWLDSAAVLGDYIESEYD